MTHSNFGSTGVVYTKPPLQAFPTEDLISYECDALKHLLLEKNKSYGDSALKPLRVFSKADAHEQLRVRIDDKLSRLARGHEIDDDTIKDLIGYLILLRIAMRQSGGT